MDPHNFKKPDQDPNPDSYQNQKLSSEPDLHQMQRPDPEEKPT
jgi:hypothetical protein